MIYEKTTNRDGVEIISYTDENGVMYSFPADENNSDYQAYLNPDKVEHLTEIPTPPAE
jgi:hypothetical protein